MRTDKQAEASRINGAKSKGPLSPETKAKSAGNSLKHGLYSKRALVLSTEKQHDLDNLRARYYAEWRPQDQRQLDTVDKLVDAEWRYLRYTSMEKWLVDNKMSEMRYAIPVIFGGHEPDLDLRATLAYDALYKEGPTLDRFQRERRSLTRMIERLTALLLELQKDNPPPPVEIEEEPEQEICRNEPKDDVSPFGPVQLELRFWGDIETPRMDIPGHPELRKAS